MKKGPSNQKLARKGGFATHETFTNEEKKVQDHKRMIFSIKLNVQATP